VRRFLKSRIANIGAAHKMTHSKDTLVPSISDPRITPTTLGDLKYTLVDLDHASVVLYGADRAKYAQGCRLWLLASMDCTDPRAREELDAEDRRNVESMKNLILGLGLEIDSVKDRRNSILHYHFETMKSALERVSEVIDNLPDSNKYVISPDDRFDLAALICDSGNVDGFIATCDMMIHHCQFNRYPNLLKSALQCAATHANVTEDDCSTMMQLVDKLRERNCPESHIEQVLSSRAAWRTFRTTTIGDILEHFDEVSEFLEVIPIHRWPSILSTDSAAAAVRDGKLGSILSELKSHIEVIPLHTGAAIIYTN
jgi:hypothetical protein